MRLHALARYCGFSVRHRFEQRGTALLVSGGGGKAFVLDISEARLIEDDDCQSQSWSKLIEILCASTGCSRENVQLEEADEVMSDPHEF